MDDITNGPRKVYRTPRGFVRITSTPDPDRLEIGCDKIWDEIERILRRHGQLEQLGTARTPRELVETGELWERYLKLRAYSNYYREVVRRDALLREGHRLMPEMLEPRMRR